MIIKFFYYFIFSLFCYTLNINNLLLNNHNTISVKYFIKKTCINNYIFKCNDIKNHLIKFTNTDKRKIIITIPEGYTINNIFLLIDNSCSSIDRGKFEMAMHINKYNNFFLKEFEIKYNWLEGYFFPDTYFLNTDLNPVLFFSSILNNFESKIYNPLLKKSSTIDMHNIIIIASIIERESKFQYERPIISSIIYNRLKLNGKLEIDATIQYIIEHKNKLSLDDTRLISNYNTYLYTGLPINPISSPGYHSIYSAIFPYKTKFYFYVANDNGKHFFSRTFNTHNKHIIKIRKRYL